MLMVVLDDTGLGHLGCYGSPMETPTTFDALAADGLRFNHMHTTAPCERAARQDPPKSDPPASGDRLLVRK